jgi:hypothetical protein
MEVKDLLLVFVFISHSPENSLEKSGGLIPCQQNGFELILILFLSLLADPE